MSTTWKPSHLTVLYGIVMETARQWSIEFGQYLSPTAQPGKHKHKIFTDEDMRVFSLVAEMKRQGSTNEEIHASLQSGQRGEIPAMPPEQVSALATNDRSRSLELQLAFVQQQLIQAQEEMNKVDVYKTQLEQEARKNIELAARYDEVKHIEKELRGQIIELSKQLGREYAEGYKAGLKDAHEEG